MEYKLLSFDVGIKNLAFCVIKFDKTNPNFIEIDDWGLINLKADLWIPDHNEKKCKAKDKKGNICGKGSSCWIIDGEGRKEMCRVHSKQYEKNYYELIKTECDDKHQNFEKLQYEFYPYELKDLVCRCGEKSRKFRVVNDGMVRLVGYCNKCGKVYEKVNGRLEKVNQREDDTKLYTRLYEGLMKFDEIDEVVIENQPALKNPRMKSIQMFIYSYFFIRGKTVPRLENIGFFSATKKLNPTAIVEEYLKKKEDLEGGEELEEVEEEELSEYKAYKKRKNDSVAIVKEVVKDMEKWRDYFLSHPKKDDLADSLLQGIAQWSLHKKY